MLNVPALINAIIAEIPDEYNLKTKVTYELDFVKKSAPYRAPECLYLSLDDTYMVLKNYVLKYFEPDNYPEWVTKVLELYWEGESLL